MVVRYIAAVCAKGSKRRAQLSLVLIACLMAGCSGELRPRSYMQFMEDSIAREGTLARCNRDREATAAVAECINARRAAATIAARADERLREQREANSDALLAAVRDRADSDRNARRLAEAAAHAAAAAAYEAQWAALQEREVQTPQPGYAAPAPPPTAALDFIELPPSASVALPYVRLPESARRREIAAEPTLEEVALPDWVAYRD